MPRHYRIIYDVYDERADFDSESSNDLPYAFGVQAIIQNDEEVGVEMVYGRDYFIWRYGRWQNVQWDSLVDYLAHTDKAHVLFGRLMPRKDWFILHDRIKHLKTAWLPGEEWDSF